MTQRKFRPDTGAPPKIGRRVQGGGVVVEAPPGSGIAPLGRLYVLWDGEQIPSLVWRNDISVVRDFATTFTSTLDPTPDWEQEESEDLLVWLAARKAQKAVQRAAAKIAEEARVAALPPDERQKHDANMARIDLLKAEQKAARLVRRTAVKRRRS